jgi:hypothetical protein
MIGLLKLQSFFIDLSCYKLIEQIILEKRAKIFPSEKFFVYYTSIPTTVAYFCNDLSANNNFARTFLDIWQVKY